MPTPPRLTLASLLEKLFDLENNVQIKALLVLPLLGLGFWFMSRDRLPTRAAALAEARRSAGSGVVIQKRLTPREQFALSVMSNGRLVSQDFWEYYYPPAVANDTITPLSYEESQLLALTAYVRVGDSLVKKPGELFVQVKRETTTRTFQYRNPYP